MPFLLSLRQFNITKHPRKKNNIGARELGKGKPSTINLILRIIKRIIAAEKNIFLLIYGLNSKFLFRMSYNFIFLFICQIIFHSL